MEEVFKRCYYCFDASFDPKCRLPRRAINSSATPDALRQKPQSHKDFIYCNVSHRAFYISDMDYCCVLLWIQCG